MRSRKSALVAAVAVGGLALGVVPIISAPSGGAAAAPVNSAGKERVIKWGECPPGLAGPPNESVQVGVFECGTLDVPMDYQKPNGAAIEIALSRLRSTDPKKRRGVLLLNPGGPGAAGLGEPLVVSGRGAPASLLAAYDLIGFDPRGVGHSTPLTCGLSQEQQVGGVLPAYPQGPEDVAKQAEVADEIVRQCVAMGGEKLQYLTTNNTARDMDQIRKALGERKISYHGTSYGTYLGSVYRQLFPERSDRFVLDSAVGPEMVWREAFRNWGPGTELRFPDFGKWAADRHGTYGLGRTAEEVREKYFELAEEIDEAPIGGLDGNSFRQLTRLMLYSDGTFPQLAEVWQGLDGADAAPVRRVRAEAEIEPPAMGENFYAMLVAVQCNDVSWPTSLRSYQRDVETDRKRYPLVGAMTANISPCARWPWAPKEKPTEITDDGPSNVLILQNLRDPATIYAGAVQMHEKLGDRSRLVSVDGGEHGVYLGGNTCADDFATRYLVSGRLPVGNRFCAGEAAGRG